MAHAATDDRSQLGRAHDDAEDAALSSSLIALAFIGQMSRLRPAFDAFDASDAFVLIVLSVLAFIGIVMFERLVQTSLEDIACAKLNGRLRRPPRPPGDTWRRSSTSSRPRHERH